MIVLARNPLAAGLMIALILVGGSTGAGWWLAARDRDAAQVELAAERAKSAELAAAVIVQNRAVEEMKGRTTEAERRGQDAQKLAAAQGKRLDRALERVAGAKAATCAEAMPTVDAVLEAIR